MGARDKAIKAVGAVAARDDVQFLLFSDGSHFEDANYDFFTQKAVIDELAKNGYKHIVLEMSDIQDKLKGVGNGSLPKGTLLDSGFVISNMPKKDSDRTVANLERLAEYCNEKGIKIHCKDNLENCSPQMKKFVDAVIRDPSCQKILNKLASQREVNSDELMYLNAVLKDNDLENFDPMGDRIEADKYLARDIKKIAGNDKVAIFYGAAHGATKRDLDEYLGSNKTAKILLTPNAQTIHLLDNIAKEMPSTIIFTDTSKWPGNQVEAWQAHAKQVGSEITGIELRNTKYSQINLPPQEAPDMRVQQPTTTIQQSR